MRHKYTKATTRLCRAHVFDDVSKSSSVFEHLSLKKLSSFGLHAYRNDAFCKYTILSLLFCKIVYFLCVVLGVHEAYFGLKLNLKKSLACTWMIFRFSCDFRACHKSIKTLQTHIFHQETISSVHIALQYASK